MKTNEDLYRLYRQGMNYIESDPDECIRLLSHVSQLAERLGNAYYRVLCDHWRLQALIIYKRDYQTANQLAIKAAIDVRQPVYLNFTEYVCIQQDLIMVYQGIDPLGYAPHIKEAIDLMIEVTTPQMQCNLCLMQTLVQYHMDISEREEAKNQAAKYFSMTETAAYHRGFASSLMCQLLYEEAAYSEMLNYARLGVKASERDNWVHYWVELKAWEMLAMQVLGDGSAAQSIYWMITSKMGALKMIPHHRYFTALRAYHEARNDIPAALELWETYIKHLTGSGQSYWEAMALIEKIRLLRLLGRDYSAESQAVRQIAQSLKSAASIITRLEAIAA